ncbi:MAG: CU044_2847 family protein [Acidimicrobiales bacterium]
MGTRVVEVDLGNGTTALVQAVEIRDDEALGAEKVGWRDGFDFAEVTGTLAGIAGALRAAVDAAKPDAMTVELGLALAVKSGKLTGMLVEGSGTASLKITLEWQRADAPA